MLFKFLFSLLLVFVVAINAGHDSHEHGDFTGSPPTGTPPTGGPWGHEGHGGSPPTGSPPTGAPPSKVIQLIQKMSLVTHFLSFDAAFASISGFLLYVAPHYFADALFQKPTDGVHWHLMRCVGGQIFASSLVSYRFRTSSPVSQSVCHFIRIIPSILCLILLFQLQSMTPELVPTLFLKLVKFTMFGTIATHIALLSRSGWITGQHLAVENKFGNFLYQLDALASICIGVAWMTFPKWLLHRQVLVELDATHELLGRVMGANFIASYIVSTHSLYWDSQNDRNVAVDSRVLCCISILGGQLWSQTYEHWSGNHWIGITLFSTWTIISLIYRTYLTVNGSSSTTKKAQ